ncbi:MAG: FG-GAP-like repeat-containing protein [Bacteroidota bacterium]
MKHFFWLLLLATWASFAQGLFAQPAIAGFTPQKAAVGQTVVITGSNFNTAAANNIVFFGATKAVVTFANAGSISAIVPSGTSYAPITVLNTGTGLLAYSRTNFHPVFTPNKNTITTADFAPKQDFATGDQPQSIAMGDLDGDGKPDLAIANLQAGTVSILRNTGTTGAVSFATKIDFPVGANPSSVALGDFNGDGKLDFAVANNVLNDVTVYKNASTPGAINFNYIANVPVEAEPWGLAIADMDADGKADLVTTSLATNKVSVNRYTGNISIFNFGPVQPFATSQAPYLPAVGDLNDDGRPDLVVPNYFSASVSVLLNQSAPGSLSFQTNSYATGSAPTQAAIGDIDEDGFTDIVVTNKGPVNISVLRNSGIGSFSAKTDFTTGISPEGVSVADLNGDGKLDIATVNSGSNSSSVFVNISTAGTFNFRTRVDFATALQPTALSVGDLDGDGKCDILATNAGSNTVSIFRNTPQFSTNADLSSLSTTTGSLSPSFSPGILAYRATNYNPLLLPQITAASAQADAKLEMRVNGGAYSFLASGTPTIINGLQQTINTLDIRVTAQNGIATKVYTITITQAIAPVITSILPVSGTVGSTVTISGSNFNASPSANIVYMGATKATVTLASPNSLSVTVPPGATYAPVTVLDGVTTRRLAYSRANFNPTFAPFKSTLSADDFSTKIDFAVNSAPRSIVLSDIDGDGKTDIVVGDRINNILSVFRNTSTSGSIVAGSFAPKVDFAISGIGLNHIAVGDFNSDGKPDLVLTNRNSANVSVLRNTSTTGIINSSSFAAQVNYTTVVWPDEVAVGDVDGDGRPDLVTASFDQPTISILRNNTPFGGAISFESRQDFGLSAASQSLAINDLDGDGKADIVVSYPDLGLIGILRNTGNVGELSLAASVNFSTGILSANGIVIGDIDGDGKPDLAIPHQVNSQNISIFRNISSPGSITTGSFAPKQDFNTGPLLYSLALADVNGDGKPDMAVTNNSLHTISVFCNQSTPGNIGAGTFASPVSFGTHFGPTAMAIGDLDGDGKPDMVSTNSSSGNISVLRNNLFVSTTLYVKKDAAGNNSGTSWANAFSSLQDALNSNNPNVTQIWVAKGTYTPTNTSDRNLAFVMKNNTGIYGGFAGTETQLSQRNWRLNPTILSGDIGTPNNIADNSYNIIRNDNNGLNATAILDGFTISGGNANGGTYLTNRGGGINNYLCSPAITNCQFLGNNAVEYGGAMFNQNAIVKLVNCVFAGNTALYGGGLYNESAATELINCTMAGNAVTVTGAAMYTYGIVSPKLTNTIIWGNGSGIQNAGGATPIVTNSIVQGGYAGSGNLSTDPVFVIQPQPGLGNVGDLRLLICSPAINMGNNAALPVGVSLDLAGRNRIVSATVDMGAYEWQNASGLIIYVDATATGGNYGNSWANAFTSLEAALNDMNICNFGGALTMHLAAGTYAFPVGKNIQIDNLNALLLGGFPPGGGTRNTAANPVIIKGNVRVLKSLTMDGVKVEPQ